MHRIISYRSDRKEIASNDIFFLRKIIIFSTSIYKISIIEVHLLKYHFESHLKHK